MSPRRSRAPRTGWSEESLHRWLLARGVRDAQRRGSVVSGSRGHDAAVLSPAAGRSVTCLDQTVEGVHFEPDAPGRRVGAKAVARALSDLAATAATPRAILIGLSAPATTPEVWLRAALGGAADRARELGAELVGGDLCAAPGPRSLAVTALGLFAGRGRPPGRDRARPGDRLVLTGALGGSSLGRHLRIEPRLTEGRWLHARGARVLMDVSDGLALDLARIARLSGVRIDLEHVPVHADARRLARSSGRSALDHALHDGEDHELIAALRPADLERALAARGRPPGLCVVARVRPGRGLWVPGPGQESLQRWRGGGYVHGA